MAEETGAEDIGGPHLSDSHWAQDTVGVGGCGSGGQSLQQASVLPPLRKAIRKTRGWPVTKWAGGQALHQRREDKHLKDVAATGCRGNAGRSHCTATAARVAEVEQAQRPARRAGGNSTSHTTLRPERRALPLCATARPCLRRGQSQMCTHADDWAQVL